MRDYTQLYFNAVETDDIHKLIKDLIRENKTLHIENNYYRNIEHFLIKNENESYKLTFKHEESPMAIDAKISSQGNYFLTITFDPKRFDNLHLTSTEEQKDYILLQLHKMRNTTNFLYGCFEKHQNDIIHSHLIINPTDLDAFKKDLKKLKSAFTYNINNKYTIDFQYINDLEKVLNYIDNGNKEKFGFFQYINSRNLL